MLPQKYLAVSSPQFSIHASPKPERNFKWESGRTFAGYSYLEESFADVQGPFIVHRVRVAIDEIQVKPRVA